MKERPILFSAPMVRAILDGRKTMTRRKVKMPDGFDFTGGQGDSRDDPANWGGEDENGMWWALAYGDHVDWVLPCPYGHPGDRLWVRETFVQGYDVHPITGCLIQYDAAGNELRKKTWYRATDEIHWTDDDGWEANVPWKPSIHMPRALSRLTLEIIGARVERLQDISEADALAEGIHQVPDRKAFTGGEDWWDTPREAFAALWESINGAGSWDDNPFVWVIEFRRIEQEAKAA